MADALAYLKDRWEWDSVWRDQIILAIILGAIGLTFAVLEAQAAVKIGAPQ